MHQLHSQPATMAHHNGGAQIDTRRTRAAGLIIPIEAQPHLEARQAERLDDQAAAERHRELLEQRQGSNSLDGGFVAGIAGAVVCLVYLTLTSMGSATPANVTLMVLGVFAVAAIVMGLLFAITFGRITQPNAEDDAWIERNSGREA